MTHTPEIASLPCGCKFISREYANGEYGAIDFCPLHKAAPDLLEALEEMTDLAERAGFETVEAREIIAKARPAGGS